MIKDCHRNDGRAPMGQRANASEGLAPAKQLSGFLVKFEPRVAALASGALSRLRIRLPGAFELEYDNYNPTAEPTHRPSVIQGRTTVRNFR
jgi:hypothetical protein